MCTSSPEHTGAIDHDCTGDHVVADHSEQGWRRLCNGVIVFDDGGFLTPDGRADRPARPTPAA